MRVRTVPYAVLLLVGLFGSFALQGCERDGQKGKRDRPVAQGEAMTTIWVGGAGPIAVFLTPLSSEARSARWQSSRLEALIGDGNRRSFHLLRIANLGAGAETLPLTGIGLTMEVDGRMVAWDDLRDALLRDTVATSTLAYRALVTYEGGSLRGSETLDGVVAFPGDLSLAAGSAVHVSIAGRDLTLTRKSLSDADLRGLLEHPTREQILASLPFDARVELPAGAAEGQR